LGATLVFDSGTRLQSAPMRGGANRSRTMIYSAGSLTAYLTLQHGEDQSAVLAGQVAPAGEFQRYQVALWRDDAESPEADFAANDLGYFALRDLRPGTYSMVIQGEEVVMAIPDLALAF
jgi:hypothetical protein